MNLTRIGKCAQAAICLTFLFLVIVPHVMELAGKDGSTASIEKRESAKAPDPGLIFKSFSQYARQFEKYYDDSFGLRDKLIRWNGLLRLRAFDDSFESTRVKTGREGWLFYAQENALKDYMNVIPFKSEDLERMGRVLEERRVWLEGKGIKFFILVAPNKPTIYSEYLPRYIHKIGKESRLDQLKTYLERYPKLEFVDVRDVLFKAKKTQRLYYKTDTHWNNYGAFVAYAELMERISLYFPAIKKQSLDDFTVAIRELKGGDEASLLSLSESFKDEGITLVPKFARRARNASPGAANPVHGPVDTIIKEVDDPHLLKAVIFHDSFSQPLVPFLSESFGRTIFLLTFDFLPELIEREKPDVVIFECVERYLSVLSKENPPAVKSALYGSR